MPNFSTSEWSFSVDKKLAIIYAIGFAVKEISKWHPGMDSTSYTVNNATKCNAKTLIFREIIAAKVMISCIMVAWFQRGYFSRLWYKNGMMFQHHRHRNTQQSLIILKKTRLSRFPRFFSHLWQEKSYTVPVSLAQKHKKRLVIKQKKKSCFPWFLSHLQ